MSAAVLVEIIGPKGAAIWHEAFDVSDLPGEEIVSGIHMVEKVNAAAHKAIYQLMNNAADRIRYDLVNAPGQKDTR